MCNFIKGNLYKIDTKGKPMLLVEKFNSLEYQIKLDKTKEYYSLLESVRFKEIESDRIFLYLGEAWAINKLPNGNVEKMPEMGHVFLFRNKLFAVSENKLKSFIVKPLY